MFKAVFSCFLSQTEMIACRNPIMKKLLSFLATVTLALFFAGCATGLSYNSLKDSFPPLAAGTGRIFIYRDAVYNPGKTPAVLLNGEQVGLSKARGFFYVDRPAGDNKVEVAGENSPPAGFTLGAGQTIYVRISVHATFTSPSIQSLQYPEVVDTATAEREIASCKHTEEGDTLEIGPKVDTVSKDEPQNKVSPGATKDESTTNVGISIDQGGQISINGDPIPDDQLLPLLKEDHNRDPNVAVLIKADKSTPLQKIDNVLHACTAAGVTRLSLQTQ